MLSISEVESNLDGGGAGGGRRRERTAADADWWFRQLCGRIFLARFLSQLCARLSPRHSVSFLRRPSFLSSSVFLSLFSQTKLHPFSPVPLCFPFEISSRSSLFALYFSRPSASPVSHLRLPFLCFSFCIFVVSLKFPFSVSPVTP